MADDPYRVLGVQKDATDAEIKRTYRKLARQHHPDRNPDDAAAEERFKAIQAAYDQIGTAAARKEYDQQRRMDEMFARGGNPFSGFGGGGGGFRSGGVSGGQGIDFSDILNQFMGGMGGAEQQFEQQTSFLFQPFLLLRETHETHVLALPNRIVPPFCYVYFLLKADVTLMI